MLYLDTNKLSLYIDDVLDEKRTAQKLFDEIKNIERLTYLKCNIDKGLVFRFQHLIEKSDNLVSYYSKLYSALDQTAFDAFKMINETNDIMNNYLDLSNSLINQDVFVDDD